MSTSAHVSEHASYAIQRDYIHYPQCSCPGCIDPATCYAHAVNVAIEQPVVQQAPAPSREQSS